MTDRNLSILAVVAGVLVVLTILVYSGGETATLGFEKNQLLIQGLDPEKVETITISKDDEKITLNRQEDGFVISEYSNYPASPEKVNKLIIKAIDIRCAALITDRPENHAELGVATGGGTAQTVTFTAAGGQELVTLVVGKSAEKGLGNYVRLGKEDTVYISDKPLSIANEATALMETNLLNAPATKIQSVRVQGPESTYDIRRDVTGKAVLPKAPEGKRAKADELKKVMGAISWLNFEDVKPASGADINLDHTFTARLDNHLSYVVRLGSKDEKYYIQITAEGPDEATLQKVMDESRRLNQQSAETGKAASDEELKKNDAILEAHSTASEFNERHAPWLYTVSKWTADKMIKPLSALVEDIPDPETPEEVAASHILISYKGAERSDSKRGQEEARKLAEDVLAKAKAEGADFAALAKEYSDGPSSGKGGDLGTFKKGAMHENFEKAAWKLEVGEISDIIETPFGYHIIKRTK